MLICFIFSDYNLHSIVINLPIITPKLVPFSTHHIQTNHHIMFYYPFLPLKILKVDKLTLSNLITPKHIPQGNTHIPYT